MEEKVTVSHGIELALLKKKLHMLLEPPAVHERGLKSFHDIGFFRRKPVRICRINSRQILVEKIIVLSVLLDLHRIKIDTAEQIAVFHVIFRASTDKLAFQLELDNRDSLMNAHVHVFLAAGFLLAFCLEACTRIIPISIYRKLSKGYQIDAVAFLENVKITVSGLDPDNICNARKLTAGCAHPLDIMIAPLNVKAVVSHQRVHDLIRSVSSVVNIAENMQMINDEPSHQPRKCFYEIVGIANADNSVDDLLVVGFLVRYIRLFGDEFLDHIAEIFRHSLPYFRSCVLAGSVLAHVNEPIEHDFVPVIKLCLVSNLFLYKFDLFARIVDQRRQFFNILFRQSMPVNFTDLLFYSTGAVPENMGERFIFAVNISDKVFCTFGQIQY